MAKRNGEVSGMRDACAGGKLEDVQDEMQRMISKQSIDIERSWIKSRYLAHAEVVAKPV